jgi:hypothetical protein
MTNFTINPSDKFYPAADEWMWDYAIFLGKFTDSEGRNFDLGVHIDYFPDGDNVIKDVMDATVHSNEAGDYTSGEIREANIASETREWKLEVYRRAKVLNLI